MIKHIVKNNNKLIIHSWHTSDSNPSPFTPLSILNHLSKYFSTSYMLELNVIKALTTRIY